MRKLIISAFLIVGMVAGVDAAPRSATRGGSSSVSSGGVTSARGAVRSRSATQSVVGRSAVAPRSATTQKVAARAATPTQKVVNSGTKVAGAIANTTVSQELQDKYFGCMDSFCMLDNTSGGRCLCSDRSAELDAVLAEIDALDAKAYEMGTIGVEQIELGDDAQDVIDRVNKAVNHNVT